jgi:hypothetical protein
MLKNSYLYQSFVNAYGYEVQAKYCFESELVEIPNTEMYLEVDFGMWVIYSEDTDSIDMILHEDFIVNYNPVDKIATNYLEFVVDSISSDYSPVTSNLDEVLIETVEEFVEKEISLSFLERLKLIWKIILGKKIYISKY